MGSFYERGIEPPSSTILDRSEREENLLPQNVTKRDTLDESPIPDVPRSRMRGGSNNNNNNNQHHHKQLSVHLLLKFGEYQGDGMQRNRRWYGERKLYNSVPG